MRKRQDLINPSKGTVLNRQRVTIRIVWCVFLSVAFSGCLYIGSGSSRVNLDKETASKIIPGKTTREEVLTMLGPPDEVLGGGKQIRYVRKYEVALIFSGGPGSGTQLNPANRYLLKVDFDEQGIVSRRDFIAPYEFHDKPVHGDPPFSPPPSWR